MYYISNIFRSISFSMFISTSNVLLQNSPRQSPQAATHFSPLRKHENIREPHVFFDNALQLHRMKFSISTGAGSRSPFIGCKLSFIWYQPQSSGFKYSRSKVLHWQTYKWTRKAWKCIALSDGGRFCGLRVKEVVTLSINLAYLSDARVSDSFPL